MEKWIKIEDQLPNEDDRVLVCVINKPDNGDKYIVGGRLFLIEVCPSKFQLDYDTVSDTISDDREITHWMPLPAFPN